MFAKSLRSATLVAAAALAVACAGQRRPAEDALTAAQQAVAALPADAAALMPDEFAAVRDTLDAARESFAARRYGVATASAQAAGRMAHQLQRAATAKKDELTRSWTAMSDSLPGLLTALESQVDQLAKARRLPAGVSKAAVTEARAAVDSLEQEWTRATTAYTSGKLGDAVALGTSVKSRAATVITKLKIQTPMRRG